MDTQNHSWTVVAAGPSLAEYNAHQVSAMPNVVAVNRAFYWIEGRCKAWCVLEEPRKQWNMMGLGLTREILRDQEVWVPKSKAWGYWKKEFPDANRVAMRRTKINGGYVTSPGWETDLSWSNGSTIAALATCCLRGAKEITLLGCDQTGAGGWGYTETKNPKPWWTNRWKLERIALERCTKEAADHGVRITRLSPLDRLSLP